MDLLIIIIPLLTLALIGWIVDARLPIAPARTRTMLIAVIALLSVSMTLWGLRVLTQNH